MSRKIQTFARLLIVTVIFAVLSGCAMAWGRHELTPLGHYASASVQCNNPIEIMRKGEALKKPAYRVAALGAHGNGYADQNTLEKTLIEEARKVCADLVMITGSNVSRDETIASYGGGVMVADKIRRPHLYGVAYKYAKTSIGINCDKDGIIEYVRSGSTAEKNGLKEGMKLLTVNGIFIKGDHFALEREILSQEPGAKVRIEYIDKNGEKNAINIILEAWGN
jgi:hypothetical protein